MDKRKTKRIVKEAYGKIAQSQEGCSSCGSDTKGFAKSILWSAVARYRFWDSLLIQSESKLSHSKMKQSLTLASHKQLRHQLICR